MAAIWMTSLLPSDAIPIIFTLSSSAHNRLSIKGQMFSKCRKKSKEGGAVGGLRPPPLYHGWCISLRVRPRVKPLLWNVMIMQDLVF